MTRDLTRETPARADAAEVADALLVMPPSVGTTRLVAFDGPAGSGKTTFAAAMHEELTSRGLGVVTMHMDDLYEGWTGLRPGLEERVLTQLLHPLSEGRRARWQQYDWEAGRFDRWQDLDPPAVLILEGCGSGARAYAPYTDMLVWVEADRDVRIGRGVERDGEQVLPHWLAWMDLENAYFAANDTRARADILLSTTQV
jgi:uridine kinase